MIMIKPRNHNIKASLLPYMCIPEAVYWNNANYEKSEEPTLERIYLNNLDYSSLEELGKDVPEIYMNCSTEKLVIDTTNAGVIEVAESIVMREVNKFKCKSELELRKSVCELTIDELKKSNEYDSVIAEYKENIEHYRILQQELKKQEEQKAEEARRRQKEKEKQERIEEQREAERQKKLKERKERERQKKEDNTNRAMGAVVFMCFIQFILTLLVASFIEVNIYQWRVPRFIESSLIRSFLVSIIVGALSIPISRIWAKKGRSIVTAVVLSFILSPLISWLIGLCLAEKSKEEPPKSIWEKDNENQEAE